MLFRSPQNPKTPFNLEVYGLNNHGGIFGSLFMLRLLIRLDEMWFAISNTVLRLDLSPPLFLDEVMSSFNNVTSFVSLFDYLSCFI